ncbi:Hypothetical predicted protein [Paramuricea clavata]|uniref:Uncharacterized protein n=1 Tax=Paramuricea clavata TaxID=317549 RepID=A0A7D9ECV3_PARCT|nr:Hypothetical predicted protein [Paramuricea clavata]
MSVHGSEANRVVENEFGSVSLEETRIRSNRSIVKRTIATTLRKLEGIVSKFGGKTIIKGSKSSGKGAEVRAKAFAAELKAKQLMEEEEKTKQELEKQLELEKNIAMAKEIAERAKLEADRRKTKGPASKGRMNASKGGSRVPGK